MCLKTGYRPQRDIGLQLELRAPLQLAFGILQQDAQRLAEPI
ncbi:hypothetical protein [Pantoea agglomerans]|nr:hypothetical protein [Pantoea agglomerans]